jgi:Immunoglobulin-like domain of bacterial spore germination/Sporulation and spore germination
MRALSHVGGEIDHRTHPVGNHARMTQLGRWAVAVALVAATVTGCAQAADPVGRTGATSPTPAPTSAAAGERALPVYYVAETAAGPRLQREFHRLPAADPGTAAVREMLAHPTGTDPDYRNPWPAGAALSGPVASAADAITVDLTAAPPSELAAQQLVFTVQGALGSTTPVRLLANGVPTGPPIPRGDPYALRSLVQIDAPADGTSAASPLAVTGEAAVFEATLHWTVLSGSTTVRTGVTSTAEGQTFAPFRFSLDLPPGRYTVRISEDDPSDGAGRPVLTDDRTVTVT